MAEDAEHHGHPDGSRGPDRHAHIEHDGHPYEVWDVFADTPLEGNPLGVFPVAEELPSRLYGRLARELNLSETVFLLPDDPAEADALVRIFTPSTELPFAGHPVLGAAFSVARRTGRARVRLRTGAGIVAVTLTRDEHGELVEGEMHQPIPAVAEYAETAALLAALGVDRAELPVEIYTNGPSHVVVMLDSLATLSGLDPDLGALARLGGQGIACLAPTGEGPHTVRSRNFCPGLGVPEDPATGSAAGPAAVHLLRHGRLGAGERLEIHQGVEMGRPSRLQATVEGSAERIEVVRVAGAAVRVGTGHYRVG